jgi:hypothetical protein
VFVLTGLACQVIGMILIICAALLAGLFSLPIWVLMILRDLGLPEWFDSTRKTLSGISGGSDENIQSRL